ncbi:hypothetical protein AAKU67_004492 [Oxalobacteraceae bacterium GrIS 2.11]
MSDEAGTPGTPGAPTAVPIKTEFIHLADLESENGRILTLGDEENSVGRVNPLETAKARSITADTWFRGVMVLVVCGIFIWLNWNVMSFLRAAFAQDNLNLIAKPPIPASDRLITSNVVMTLIGATVVQTGVGFIAVMSYLFPKRAAAGTDSQDAG